MAETEHLDSEPVPERIGERLRREREAAGMSLAEVSRQTRIAERQLTAIEEGRFADLASPTYAIGFARAYARALSLGEKDVAAAVRAEIEAREAPEEPQPVTFEPGDPARVPSPRIAWLAGVGALAVAVAVFVVWRSYYVPAVSLSDLVPEPTVAPAAPGTEGAPGGRAPPPAQRSDGPVVFTALEANIWVKFYDSSGQQLMQKQMALGETYTVPADASGPKLWTARPDALRIAVGGKEVPGIGDKAVRVKDVPVDAASLLARAATVPTGAS